MMTLNTLVLSTLHQHWHAFHLNVTQISGEARRVCMKAAGVGGWECKGIITLNYQFAYWNPSLMHRFWSVCVCNITDWVKDWSASSEIPLFNANDDLKVVSSVVGEMKMNRKYYDIHEHVKRQMGQICVQFYHLPCMGCTKCLQQNRYM